jgi:hypothetical protein
MARSQRFETMVKETEMRKAKEYIAVTLVLEVDTSSTEPEDWTVVGACSGPEAEEQASLGSDLLEQEAAKVMSRALQGSASVATCALDEVARAEVKASAEGDKDGGR